VKVSVEKLPTSEAVLNIDVTWDEMEKASDKAYRKLVRQVDIQGFRRGKAPRSLLERRVGKEYIYQEGLDELITDIYRDAVKEHELTPITQPKLDAPVFEMGQDYHFTLTVPILTPVELADYSSLHFEREEASVTSEEVDKELERLRNRLATHEEVTRPAEYGDRVTVDLKLTSGDQKISDLKDNPFELTNERVGVFSGMDEHIVGMSADESKAFSTTIPEDYSNEKLAGQQGDYEITVHKVEAKNLPELNDEFARQASEEQYESFEELTKGLSDNILENKKRSIREDLREKALSALVEQSTFVIHPALVDEQVDENLHRLGHMLEDQHLSMDQYLMMTRKSLAEYKTEIRPDAEQQVKRELVLDELAKREQVSVSSEELEALLNFYAQSGQPLPRTEEQQRSLLLSFRREKVLTRLVELTAGPDPDVSELEETEEAEVTEENAQAAALASEAISADAHNVTSNITSEVNENEASATATPLPGDSTNETVE
jgi:trigger factor